jgi:hypothetical protein
MLKSNDGFLNLSKVQTISDNVAKVLAEYQRAVVQFGLPD